MIQIKNTYITSHFPLLSILIFSFSFALYTEDKMIQWLDSLGLYIGLLEFFSETSFKLALLFLLSLTFFMLFSALKLIANTVSELALFFFSKDAEGKALVKIRSGSIIFIVGSVCALLLNHSLFLMVVIFAGACFVYFVFFLMRVSEYLTLGSMFGLAFMVLSFWAAFVFSVLYVFLRVYRALLATLSL